MECNRDEALRAKEIAERKFSANDLMGAKKFALKAQNLFPALEASQHQQHNVNHNSVNDTCGLGGIPTIVVAWGQKTTSMELNLMFTLMTTTLGALSLEKLGQQVQMLHQLLLHASATIVNKTYEKVKREREEAQAAARKEEALRKRNHPPKRTHSSSGNVNVGVGGTLHELDRLGKRRRSISGDLGANYRGANTKQDVQDAQLKWKRWK
ncbi:hypothetical protein J5N97_020530 [Dioscorea zingiberensis]|uniref:Uncharacterized protein n=1 Tax=Dioscorea zingiberensis TaxID=325984 RepID=A0A9D5HDB3_9LILI|nr:hypothetical protein J5N97_020530 [Dioscorea zingiberensis]